MVNRFCIAGHIVELKAPEESVVWDACSKYDPFKTISSVAPVCSLEFAPLSIIEKGEMVYEVREKGYPRMSFYRNGGGWIVEMAPEADSPIVAVMEASIDFVKARMEMIEHSRHALSFAIDNALMLLFAISTAALDTLEIHSSVTLCDGKGYAFLGKSGTGKSTHSRLWREFVPGSELLNDDNPIIRIIDGEVWIFGSPWSGKTPCYRNLGAPLGAVVRISQSPDNKIRRLPLVEAYASMFSSCSAFRAVPGTADGIHATLSKLVSLVPMYVLDCRPDSEAAILCHSTVCGQ